MIMLFTLDKILENEPNKNYKDYANIKKKIVRLNLWDNDLIVYRCGFVFKKCRDDDTYILVNFSKTNNYGYKRISLWNKNKQMKCFFIHRIVYYAFNQERFNINNSSTDNSIDHKNGIKTDNRLSNLRNVIHQHNQFNRKKAKGYTFNKPLNKYQASIRIDGKRKYLGYFKTKTGARLKYLRVKDVLHKITEL